MELPDPTLPVHGAVRCAPRVRPHSRPDARGSRVLPGLATAHGARPWRSHHPRLGHQLTSGFFPLFGHKESPLCLFFQVGSSRGPSTGLDLTTRRHGGDPNTGPVSLALPSLLCLTVASPSTNGSGLPVSGPRRTPTRAVPAPSRGPQDAVGTTRFLRKFSNEAKSHVDQGVNGSSFHRDLRLERLKVTVQMFRSLLCDNARSVPTTAATAA